MRSSLLLLLIFVIFSTDAQKKPAPYLILISFDGFRYDYVSKFNPPVFTEFIKKGVAADGLIPSFPSKTFPNHYTLITGLYPGNHGLVDNQFYDPALQRRYSMRDTSATRDPSFYGGVPLWQLAQQGGLPAASFFWVGSEVSLHGSYPDFYLHYKESLPNEKRIEQTLSWLKLPETERPHFISLYFSLVDTEGHKSGPNSEQLRQTVLRADSLLGIFMNGLKKIDLPVNVIIVSDHGMMELKPEEKTFIPLFKLMNVSDTSVVVVNGGTQAHVYTQKVDSLYRVLKGQEQYFNVYKKEDFPSSWHYDHPRAGDLLIVAKPGYYIEDQPRSLGSWGSTTFGAHGFDPYTVKDMQGIFYAAGPNIKSGMHIKAFQNIHVYPLIAKILGLKTLAIDGDVTVLEKIYQR